MPDVADYPYISSTTTAPGDSPYLPGDVSMPRRILLVEPDISVLSAEALLLTNSNYCVTPAFSQLEIFLLRDTKEIALAIVSASLGRCLLGAVTQAVRKQWPLARILVLGHAATVLEDNLYDEEIDPYPEPKQLLDDLERLYEGSWNQRSNTLDWNAGQRSQCVARASICASDPVKDALVGCPKKYNLRETPSSMNHVLKV